MVNAASASGDPTGAECRDDRPDRAGQARLPVNAVQYSPGPAPPFSVRVRRDSPARIAIPHLGREHHHPHHRNAMDISGQAPYSRGRSPVVRWRGGMYGTEGMTRCRRPHRAGLPELVWCRCDTDLSAADMRPAALFSSPLGYADQKPLSRMATAITRRHRLAAKLSAGASIRTMPRRARVWTAGSPAPASGSSHTR